MIELLLLSGTALTAVAAAGGGISLVLFPPLPRDLGGVPDLDATARPVRIPVHRDGALDAWVIEGTRPAAIALFHGFGRTHHRAWRYASFLRLLGVHLVAVDFRSARRRGRRPTTLGHHEVRDAEAVLEWMLRSPALANCTIGFFGESLGAAVALQVAADRPEVSAVVADGAFASSGLALEDSCERWARLPRQPSASILRSLGRACTGIDPGTLSPVESMPKLAGRPVLLIHGGRDNRIAEAQVRALWRAAGETHPLWIVPEAGHNEAWRLRRSEYERRVSEFFETHLLGGALEASAAEVRRADEPPRA